MDKIELSYLTNPEVIGINLLDEHSSHHFFVDGKETIYSLNGKWKFYRSSGWIDELLDHDSLVYKDIDLPKSAEIDVPEDLIYTNMDYPWEGKETLKDGEVNLLRDPVNVFKKTFSLPKNFKGEKYLLHFEGFETALYVYLNGHFVGYSTRLYVDSEFDITPYLEEKNELVIYNFRYSASSWLLDQDYWKLSGIFRNISVISQPKLHLEDVDVKTDLINNFKDGVISIKGKTTANGKAQISLCKSDKTLLNEEIEIKSNSFSFEKEIKNILGWSAEKPNLYWLTITCKDVDGNEETSSLEVGFSHQEVIDGCVYWNGQPLLIKGVNRHEVDCYRGHNVPLDSLLFDLELLKKNNVNAIRTCHYPNDKAFYEWANRIGFYVMDECCIEGHSRMNEATTRKDPSLLLPGSNPRWTKIALDRASSMYERDKNNVCIFSWSLGNESGGGNNMAEMAKYFHSVDKKRLVHYEPEWYSPELSEHVDVRSYMYWQPKPLEDYIVENPKKPVIECEFEHAMGNSNGNFDEYMTIFRKYHNALGGFIWDYIDQGLYVNGDKKHLLYGGDSNDVPNDLNFNCNGVIYSDRKDANRSSKLRTVNEVYSPLQITFKNDIAHLELDSGFFLPKDFVLEQQDYVNGLLVSKKKIKWNGEKEIALENLELEDEHIRKIRVYNKVNGSEVIFDERKEFSYLPKEENKEMQINKEAVRYLGSRDENVLFLFSRSGLGTGLVGIEVDSKQILAMPARLTFYRPITDNDRGNLFAVYSSLYMGISKWNGPIGIEEKDNEITFNYLVGGFGAKASVAYTYGHGRYIDVEIKYFGAPNMPSLPCFGLSFPLKKEFSVFNYYGLGPLDSYKDRLQGENLALYSSNVKDELSPYSIPQECGNHEETRFVEVPLNDEYSLFFEALEKPFSFKFLPNDEFEIDNAMHIDELPETRKNHLTIFAAMRGVGGDDSWGAKVHPQYELSGESSYSQKFRISLKKKET